MDEAERKAMAEALRGAPPAPSTFRPNIELALLELTTAVIRMETVVRTLVEKTYPQGGLSQHAHEGLEHIAELDEARADILKALNAVTGVKHGG